VVVNESSDILRFRIDGRWDVDIFKEMIVEVEADNYGPLRPSSLGPSNRTLGASRSGSMLMLNWSRALDLWWSKNFSRQVFWKTVVFVGLAGSTLFLLSLQMSVSEPGRYFARVICGCLGLVLCAVSLGCGSSLLIYSTTTRSQIVARWSKLFASILRWLRRPASKVVKPFPLEIIKSYIAAYYYAALTNVSFQFYVAPMEQKTDNNFEKIIDQSYKDFYLLDNWFATVDPNELLTNPNLRLYAEARNDWKRYVKDSAMVYSERARIGSK
jgi:hypothetical protein